MVVITGQVPRSIIGTDAFQESDIVGITMPVVKHSYLLQDINELTNTFREAFYIANSGRPGPVLIDVPSDLCGMEVEFNYPADVHIPSYKPTVKGNARQIRQAVDMMKEAKRPVLYIGGGIIASNSEEELLSVAEALQIPVVTTLMAKGAFPASNPLNLGHVGMHGSYYANHAVQNADLLIAIGSRFSDRVTASSLTSRLMRRSSMSISIRQRSQESPAADPGSGRCQGCFGGHARAHRARWRFRAHHS